MIAGIPIKKTDTDLKALGAVRAIIDAGLSVPDDISVAGYDDMPGVGTEQIPLTTIRVPTYQMGKAAVEMLNEMMNTDSDVKTETLETELIIRGSCTHVKGK